MCRHPAAERADITRAVLWMIVITASLRVALAGLVGLSVDESYTVAISRQLALSYFDHPPLHVWLVGAWARLLGARQPLLLRLPDILLFAGSTWILYRLTAAIYGERAGLWAVVAFNLAPVFTLNTAGGILPDGPLIFFSLLAVWCFVRAVLTPSAQSHAAWWMLGTGTAAGLALLSKYLAIFTVLSLALYLFSNRRHLLATPAPWLALLLIVLLFVPVLLWNHQHAWASFVFQGSRAWPVGFDLGRAALDFGGQLLYVVPWIAVGSLLALWRAARSGSRSSADWLFVCLAALPITTFSLAGLWTTVLPHWPAIGWLFGFPLLGDLVRQIEPARPRFVRQTAIATAGLLICLIALLTSQATSGWMNRFEPARATRDPTLDFLDWSGLRPAADQLQLRHRGMIVATVSWIDAGKADYALEGEVPVICLSQDARQFAFMHDLRSFSGRDAYIVAAAGRPDWLRIAGPYFQRIEPAPDVALTRGGEPALTLHTAYGYGLTAPESFTPRHTGEGVRH